MKLALGIIMAAVLLVSGAMAESNLDFAFKGGMVDNFSYPGLTLPKNDLRRQGLAGAQLYFKSPKYVDLIVSLDYSWQKKSYTIAGQAFDFKTRDMAVAASIVYPLKLSFIGLYIGGGVGTHSFSHEYYRPRTLSLEDNGVEIPEIATYFGYHGLVGAKVPMASLPCGLFVESRIGEVNLPDKNVSYNNWTAGVYFSLP